MQTPKNTLHALRMAAWRLLPRPVGPEQAAWNREQEILAKGTFNVPTRRRAKAGKKTSRAIVRELRGERSMLHLGAPKGHRPVAGVLDSKTAVLFAKWQGRVERRLQERNNQ